MKIDLSDIAYRNQKTVFHNTQISFLPNVDTYHQYGIIYLTGD